MGKLDGRLAVVTGTSRGIGRAIAVLFVKEGARVAGCARSPTGGTFLDDLTTEEKRRAVQAVCDVRSKEDVLRFRDDVRASMSTGPDTVVNNAGIVARESVATLALDTWNDVLASNLTGTFLVIQAFLPAMQARKSGRIVTMASIGGRSGTPLLSAYCAAKHGVVGLTRALAEELRPDGIAVNAICPGSVDTDMLKQGMPGGEPHMQPAEVARVALFLAADAPLALTGSCIDVFG
jgi:NAD(P)-dependent dehydrogenase (short-subunit alcohol dehydrogenase family)